MYICIYSIYMYSTVTPERKNLICRWAQLQVVVLDLRMRIIGEKSLLLSFPALCPGSVVIRNRSGNRTSGHHTLHCCFVHTLQYFHREASRFNLNSLLVP